MRDPAELHDQNDDRNRDQRPERARRARHQARTETEREQVHGLAQQARARRSIS